METATFVRVYGIGIAILRVEQVGGDGFEAVVGSAVHGIGTAEEFNFPVVVQNFTVGIIGAGEDNIRFGNGVVPSSLVNGITVDW